MQGPDGGVVIEAMTVSRDGAIERAQVRLLGLRSAAAARRGWRT